MAAVGGPRLTDQQRRALTARGVSVALSAGAGCGKTFVLTERFLTQLDPDGPDASLGGDLSGRAGSRPGAGPRPRLGELVAITFTERAAREMRQRIRTTCRQRLLHAPDGQVDYWLDLVRQLDTARISTIHSFCGTLLRAHAVEARVDPQFQVLDQSQADTALYELIDDELRSRLAAQDPAVIDLVVAFGLESLREMLAAMLDRRRQIEWVRWRDVTPDELVAEWDRYRREVTLLTALENIARSPEARAVLRIARQHCPDHPEMQKRCRVLLERIPPLPESADPHVDLETIAQNARVQGGGGKKAWADETAYEEFRGAAGGLRKAIDKARSLMSFDTAAARGAAEAGLRVLALAQTVAEAYEARKQEVAALDFDDLLVRTRQLLTAPENEHVRRQIASQIRLLLVDEFQDTDPTQVELVRVLCGPMLTQGKLFFVGDYKQSIYRFRGADPHVFQELRRSTPAEGRLPLSLNFRSQPAILHFVNALFCDDLGLEYEPLEAHRPQVGPEPAVEFLWAPDEFPEERSGQMERLRRREADWIARRLRAMLEEGDKIVWDEQAAERGRPDTRPVRPGDVALLFRALSDVQYYEESLRRLGIHYYLVGGHAFYAQQEIYDLLSLLRALASRCDEVSLAGALRSPMFGLEDETLFWLAQHSEGLSGGLFDEELPGDLGDAQRRRAALARDTLAALRSIKDRVPIAELIEEALRRTGYDAVLLAEFLGQRKLANLRKLIDQARSFDRAGIFSLADFITQLSEFVARQPDEPLAATHPESTDVVRLMTIHQSKGLEFPVVVVPDVDRRMLGPSASVAFTPRLGPMVKAAGLGGFQFYAAAEKEEDRAEMTRLLYVATTRAADYLILSSGLPKLGAARGPWTELIGRRFDPLSGELRVGLPAGYPDPKIKVTTAEPPLAGKVSAGPARRSLGKLVDKAARLAASRSGRVPSHLEPVPADPTARRQYSFSRLTGALHTQPVAAEAPDLSEGDQPMAVTPRLDPLGVGTLVHDVLAAIDFSRPEDADPLVRRFAPRHLPEVQEGLEEPAEMIGRFLQSPRAAEIAASAEVYCELEFLLSWPPDNVRPDAPYLHGFIDCLYRDTAGRWIVVDYKTNQVTDSMIKTVAAQYEMQMLVYGLAVERILGQPPEDLVLCFLRPGLEHHFRWSDAARRRVVRLVGQALRRVSSTSAPP